MLPRDLPEQVERQRLSGLVVEGDIQREAFFDQALEFTGGVELLKRVRLCEETIPVRAGMRVALLSGLDEEAIGRCLAERVVPNPGAATLIRTMRVGGARAILVTGGFVSFADPIAKLLGFNAVRANRLLFDGSLLTGSVEDPIVDAQAKRDALIEAREEFGLKREETLAIGDGANDRLMVQEAGLGVAFRAKPALAEVADARLDHHGLDALLWVQGIRKRDWVKA